MEMMPFNFFRRLFYIVLMILLQNIVILIDKIGFSRGIDAVGIILLAAFFLTFNLYPVKRKPGLRKLSVLIGGYELLNNISIVLIMETGVYFYLCLVQKTEISLITLIFNAIIGMITVLIVMWNGIIRIACTSSQISLCLRILLMTTWWIPIINLIIFHKCCGIVRREYILETEKIELNNIRKDSNICQTKYPILLVHGIFWRDWQFFSYWGRIPAELMKNGATVYYGNQQSAAAMDICANEIRDQILSIIDKEKCEKVNIIAHSKGGLDSRYAISHLAMDKHVASLTTIGTPHRGCHYVDRIIKIVPRKVLFALAKRYNSVYQKLGDKNPDFYSALCDLTVLSCNEFNKKILDSRNVIYQSIASKMSSVLSAGFPMNIGYAVLRHSDSENDGFVSVTSSKWGNFIGCYEVKKRRGVSHGDMIDLMRENIYGFDVRECYVDIVSQLKLKGL